ncbi:MAG: HEAT repeat domain-containing protein [Fimbriimonadaceae bacterium]|nr:HEAT repeat domain-containing protein [Fimbriimonadaceae bacterium]
MRRAWLLWAALLAFRGVSAQDSTTAQRLVEQIVSQQAQFWPDAQVTPNKAPLFRGNLQPARDALEQLAALGDPAIPALANLLRHPRAQARANAAAGLSKIGGPATAGPLIGASTDPVAGVRYQVALALGYSGSAQALQALNTLAGDKINEVRSAAITTGAVLREILMAEAAETPEARVAELVKLAPNDAAVRRLVRLGAAAVQPLIAALNSDDKGVVAGAAKALALIGDPAGLEPLWQKYEASLKATPQSTFAQALAGYRHAQVFDYLLKLLNTVDLPADAGPAPYALSEAQYYALERLASIDHPQRAAVTAAFLEKLLAKGAHKEVIRNAEAAVNPVATACEVLGKVGDKSALPLLERVISEAPAPEKSIVKPIAQRAKAAIEQRGG